MLAYLNGNWIDYSTASVPAWDYGFAMGVSVTEQLRTFNGQLFCPDWHLERLLNGLEILRLPPPLTAAEILAIAARLVEENSNLLPTGHDLGVGICITPGPLPAFAPLSDQNNGATVLIYSYPLAFERWSAQYTTGMSLAIVATREIPDACVPRQLKCRSRVHYYLAEQEATTKSPGSRALLLDTEGNVAEATTASIVMLERDTIVVPPAAMILPGTALRFLLQLAAERSIKVRRESISPDRLRTAEEVFWLSTPMAMLPVTQVDGQNIGTGVPGPMFRQLIDAWSQKVGLDIADQACEMTAQGQNDVAG